MNLSGQSHTNIGPKIIKTVKNSGIEATHCREAEEEPNGISRSSLRLSDIMYKNTPGQTNLMHIPKSPSNRIIHPYLSGLDRIVMLIETLSTPHKRISWYQILKGNLETLYETAKAIRLVMIITYAPISLSSVNPK